LATDGIDRHGAAIQHYKLRKRAALAIINMEMSAVEVLLELLLVALFVQMARVVFA
jgi:hypothetical protein